MVKILVSYSLMYQRLLIRCGIKGYYSNDVNLEILVHYDWIEHYHTRNPQNVVINGISSSLRYLETGVSQGSILGPLLFLIYINDTINDLQCNLICLPMTRLDSHDDFKVINGDLLKLSVYGTQWLIILMH